MKFFDIIKDANQNLLRNKLRSFLTILAIFIGSFTIILSTAINAGVNDFIDKQIDSIGGEGYLEAMNTAATEQMAQMFSQETQEYTEPEKDKNADFYITDKQIEEARKIDGVKSFDPFKSAQAEWIKLKDSDTRYKLNINLVPRGNLNMDLSAGVAANPDSDEYEINLAESLSKSLGFDNPEDALGKTVIIAVPNTLKCYSAAKRADCLEEIEVKIVGVQAPGILAMGGSRVNLPLWNKINEINFDGIPAENNRATQATADVDPDKIEEVKEKMKELGLTAMSVEDEVGSVKTFFDAILIVFTIFGGIALLAAAIGIINTLFMSVQERTREIGLDKALGMSNTRVFLSFSFEAIMLGFWGSAFGIAVSMLIGNVLNKVSHATFLESLPSFKLLIFTPENLITITLVIMAIAFIAGTLPARRASKKDPIDALRYE